MSVLKLLTNYQPKYDQIKTTKQTEKILMEVLWIFISRLVNYQNQQVDGLYQDIGIQALTTISKIKSDTIQKLVKY